jgi:hypothetical protein
MRYLPLLLVLAVSCHGAFNDWDWETLTQDEDALESCKVNARHDYRVVCLGMHPTRNMLDCETGSDREKRECYMSWATWTKAADLCNAYVGVNGHERKNTLLGGSEYERCLAYILPERAAPLWGALERAWNVLWGDIGECK